jgi:hypothetical protein
MTDHMEATLTHSERDARTERLLRHLALGTPERLVPARLRLERAIGKDLARLLVTSLTARSLR